MEPNWRDINQSMRINTENLINKIDVWMKCLSHAESVANCNYNCENRAIRNDFDIHKIVLRSILANQLCRWPKEGKKWIAMLSKIYDGAIAVVYFKMYWKIQLLHKWLIVIGNLKKLCELFLLFDPNRTCFKRRIWSELQKKTHMNSLNRNSWGLLNFHHFPNAHQIQISIYFIEFYLISTLLSVV